MTRCEKCKARITTHLWIVDAKVYCAPWCQRGKDAPFDKMLKQLKRMRSES